MQDTVLAQLLYYLNTAHTDVAVAQGCTKDCAGYNTIPAIMSPVP